MGNGKKDKYFAFATEIGRSLGRFALGILVARAADTDAYAGYVLLLTAEVVVQAFCSSLWVTPMLSLAPGMDEPQRSRLIAFATQRNWVGGAIASLTLLLLMPIAGDEGVSTAHFLAFALGLFLWNGTAGVRARLQGTFQSKGVLYADVFWTLISVGGVGVAYLLDWDILLWFWLSRAVGCVVAVAWMTRAAPVPVADEAPDVERFNVMGRDMAFGSLANSACARSQPFVLAAVAAPAQLAAFGAATALVGPIRMAAVALSGVLRPRLALHFGRGDRKSGWNAVVRASAMLGGGGSLGIVLALLIGDTMAEFALGERFATLGGILAWAVAYSTIASINATLVVAIQIADSARTTAAMRLGAAILSMALVVPLAMTHGAVGAFASLVIAEVGYTAVGLWRLRNVEQRVRSSSGQPSDPPETSPQSTAERSSVEPSGEDAADQQPSVESGAQ